jgi:hypothetical protein
MANSGVLPIRPIAPPVAAMSVRALERGDLPAVAGLIRETFKLGPRCTEPALADFLARTLIDQPWADPEIPSLVAFDGRGRLVGFVAAEVRRMRFGDRSLRFAWAGHSAVAPVARTGALGFLMMRRLLDGPQDATLGDSASPLMEQMWLRLGGRRLELKGVHWVRVFRPVSIAARLAAPRRGRLRAGTRRLAGALDELLALPARRALAPRRPSVEEEVLTPGAMGDALVDMMCRDALRPDYDEAFLDWLFGELHRVKRRGELVAQLVRGARGRRLGWYIYFLRPGWRSEVLQVAATGERALGTVFDHLLAHAYAHGSAALRGRLEPGMLDVVARRRCLLWHRGAAVFHTRDPRLLAAIQHPDALVSRLEGDPWVDAYVDGVR